jgi:hypothetical protein
MRFLVALTLVLGACFLGYAGFDGFAQGRRRRRDGSTWAVIALVSAAFWCLVCALWVFTQAGI